MGKSSLVYTSSNLDPAFDTLTHKNDCTTGFFNIQGVALCLMPCTLLQIIKSTESIKAVTPLESSDKKNSNQRTHKNISKTKVTSHDLTGIISDEP